MIQALDPRRSDAETYCWHNGGRPFTFGLARGHKRPVFDGSLYEKAR
jgi:hypothetical protein